MYIGKTTQSLQIAISLVNTLQNGIGYNKLKYLKVADDVHDVIQKEI